MTTIFMKRTEDGKIKIHAAIHMLSGHELSSIGRRILHNSCVTIGTDDYECSIRRSYGQEAYFRISVHLDACTSHEAQLSALLVFYKALVPFFRITKIDVCNLVENEPAHA